MLALQDVTKTYGERTVVDQVSFSVPAGCLTGFVGANGAGKTTTMRLVLGIAAADSGAITWQGTPLDARVRRRIGYMPEERGLYPRMAVRKQLVYFARLHGMSADEAGRRADTLLERLELSSRAGDQVEELSLGNQQRAQIAVALIHQPDLLLLDEPFSGLDPVAVDSLSQLLREVADTGVPVLFSSHQLELVERLCEAVVILSAGKVVVSGSVAELRSGTQLRLVVEPDASWVGAVPGVQVIKTQGPMALIECPPQAQQRLLTEALARGTVRELTPVTPSLSDLYRDAALGQPA